VFGKVQTGPTGRRPSRKQRAATREVASYFRGALADRGELGKLAPLPNTADELRAMARSLEAADGDIVLGRAAAEATVKTMSARGQLAQYRVVAFATHGLVAGEIKGLAEPGLVLSLPQSPSAADDGLLTASEVATLTLDADWVILSACNTAAGDKPGAEALSGLARTFFYAGTRALLVSHWPVETEAAEFLTTQTFAELQKAAGHQPIGRSEALRRAMLALLEKEPHPAVWAPFMVVGEGEAER
jgi:CHAT domain-containing protein